MSSQYRIPSQQQQEAQRISDVLIEQVTTWLEPLLMRLDAYLDKRLVRTFLLSVVAILTLRSQKQGLYLSELGSYLLNGAQAPAGTKRLSNLLHSEKWGKGLIEAFLWDRAKKKVEEEEKNGGPVLCVWDGSVVEKPESEQTEGLSVVRSSKAKRLQKQRKGVWNPSGGKPITVFGYEWIGLLILGMQGSPEVAAMRWWTRKGKKASSQGKEEGALLQKVAVQFGRKVLHIGDRGYASHLRFVLRWKKGHKFFDQEGREKKLWEIARGKRSWGHRNIWDARKHCWRKMGVLAIPVRHVGYAGELWMVVGRTKGEPWYLITNEKVETEEQAWKIIESYARRWQIELTFRYEKSELAVESVRVQKIEAREKLLLLVTLAYMYLLSLLTIQEGVVKEWLLRHYCHRTGKRQWKYAIPLYRLRWALSRFWQEFRPEFPFARLGMAPSTLNGGSKNSG
jgi:hypothetical protein